MKKHGIAAFLLVFSVITAQAFTTQRIYFTTNGQSGGTPVIPGFEFNYFWSGSGQGKDGRIYMAASSHSESQGGGDVGVACYDPYAGRMSGVGTVVQAYTDAGNRVGGEYCNKVHTWLLGTADGKVWFGSENGGRGGHLLYVDQAANTLVDYSRVQKFIYRSSDPITPVLNRPHEPPGSTNGVALQGYSFKISAMNPANTRYMWTESYGNCYFHVWDLRTDSTRGFPGGHRDMRAFVVDRQGNLHYNNGSGNIMRRSVDGQLKFMGSVLSPSPTTCLYTHSFDTAFTSCRKSGQVAIYDFVNESARLLADLPDGGGNNDYRAMAVSRNGKTVYILGNGNIYQISVATGSYTNLGSLNGEDGNGYAQSCGLMDTLGNWYITVNGSGSSYLLQVHLGKDKITQLQIPDEQDGIEAGNGAGLSSKTEIYALPNPFHAAVTISWANLSGNNAETGFKPVSATLSDAKLIIYDPYGRIVLATHMTHKSYTWNAAGNPPWIYLAMVKICNRSYTRRQ
jgi:hypothetical protein